VSIGNVVGTPPRRRSSGVQDEFRNPTLVKDRHRGLVGDGALDVVNGNGITEDRPRVRVPVNPMNDALGMTLFVSRSRPSHCRQVAHCSLKYECPKMRAPLIPVRFQRPLSGIKYLRPVINSHTGWTQDFPNFDERKPMGHSPCRKGASCSRRNTKP
jgi:hypothetical protein